MDAVETRLGAAASALREARRGSRAADLPAELVPASPAEAYRVQELVIGAAGIAGWKILATAAPDQFSCSALSADDLLADGGGLVRGERAPEVEVEIAVRIAADLPPRTEPYGPEAVLAALGSAHAAFEIVESRFTDRKAASPLSVLADFQSSRGVAVGGGGAADWQGLDLPGLDITLAADGAEVARARGGASAAQVVAALTWLANHASGRGVGLTAGQFVITGARIGPIPLPEGRRVVASIDGIGAVALEVE